MAGMARTGATSLSDYNSRVVAIEVTGLCRQSVMRTSNYRVKVPCCRLGQTIQSISRMGGRIARVTILSSTPIEQESGKLSPESGVGASASATSTTLEVREAESFAVKSSTLPETVKSDQGERELTKPPPESAGTKLIPAAKTARATRRTHRIRRRISRTTKITKMGKTTRRTRKIQGRISRRKQGAL